MKTHGSFQCVRPGKGGQKLKTSWACKSIQNINEIKENRSLFGVGASYRLPSPPGALRALFLLLCLYSCLLQHPRLQTQYIHRHTSTRHTHLSRANTHAEAISWRSYPDNWKWSGSSTVSKTCFGTHCAPMNFFVRNKWYQHETPGQSLWSACLTLNGGVGKRESLACAISDHRHLTAHGNFLISTGNSWRNMRYSILHISTSHLKSHMVKSVKLSPEVCGWSFSWGANHFRLQKKLPPPPSTNKFSHLRIWKVVAMERGRIFLWYSEARPYPDLRT